MVKKAKAPSTEPEIVSFKGFDTNLQCRGFQFRVGEKYEHAGEVEACKSGFHGCEYPLDVFAYYSPGSSRYAEVRQSGKIARHSEDSKIASARITIVAEISISDIVARAVKWIFDRSIPEGQTATGTQGAASATGTQGAASATGYRAAASATGHRGAASATGYGGAASATGTQGAASATGHRGAASATGYGGRAMGATGNALFLVYRDPETFEILHAWAGIVGHDGIEPNVWYTLRPDGTPEGVSV